MIEWTPLELWWLEANRDLIDSGKGITRELLARSHSNIRHQALFTAIQVMVDPSKFKIIVECLHQPTNPDELYLSATLNIEFEEDKTWLLYNHLDYNSEKIRFSSKIWLMDDVIGDLWLTLAKNNPLLYYIITNAMDVAKIPSQWRGKK